MKNPNISLGKLVCFAFSILAFPVQAAGVLDFADPCVDAQNKYSSTAEAARARTTQVINEWDARKEPPGELRGLYVEAFREGAYKSWSDDPVNAALLTQLLTANPVFDKKSFFVTTVYPKAITPEMEADFVRKLYQLDYQQKLRPQLLAGQSEIEKTLVSKKSELDQSCKPDVFNQVLRGTIGNALSILGNNAEAAKNEKGDIAKLFRGLSGISITDIQANGIRGGPNSELSKLLGSDKSVASQIMTVLDPTSWKIEPPKLPSVNIPPIKVGNVCIPWC